MMMLERDGSLRMDARTRTHGRLNILLQHLARHACDLINGYAGWWTRSGGA